MSVESIKQQTLDLYDSLPMDLEQRKACLDIRDKIIELNYKFFGYVASGTFVENAEYEDKLQTALYAFLGMWWKYKWTPKYRGDLSFAVFFKPRITEEIRRYLATVGYSTRRTLCMKAAKQLGKPWTQVCYEDLSKVHLPNADLTALKSVLCANSSANLEELENVITNTNYKSTIDDYITDEYDTVEELLIQEMIETESKISDRQLHKMSDIYGISYAELKEQLPKAMKTLYARLKENS